MQTGLRWFLFLRNIMEREEGQAVSETAIVYAVMGLVGFVTVSWLGLSIQDLYDFTVSRFWL